MRRAVGLWVLIGLVLSIPGVVLATTDTQAPTGIFAESLAGITTIGASYSLQADASDDVDIVKATVYVNGKTVANGDMGLDYAIATTTNSYSFSLSWDTTKVANGSYKLQVQLSDSAGNNGWIELQSNSQNYVNFQVYNAANATNSTGTATTQPKSKCTGSQADTDKLTGSIITRVTNQANYLDDALSSVDAAYQKQARQSADTAQSLKDAFTISGKVNDKLTVFKTLSLHCDKDPKTDLADFKKSLVEIKQALVDYRLSVQKVMDSSVTP